MKIHNFFKKNKDAYYDETNEVLNNFIIKCIILTCI